jgi:hypothetical protein
MKFPRRIRLPEMISRFGNWLLLLTAIAFASFLTGCATSDPDNASVRPWNAPQGWENGLGGMGDMQHR